jgi:tetratricopeptide (TPR) repeat protein
MSGEFVSTQIQRGLHLSNVRRFPEAEAAFKEALSGDPENDFALHHLAIAQYHQGGREADALETIRQAVRVAPNDSDHHALAALLTAETENPKAGLAHADEAIRLDPSSPMAFFARAQLLLALRRLPEAEEAARAALRWDPNHGGAATVLSHALRMQGRTAENADQIAGMLERDPEDDAHHAAAGWNALQAGKYQDAQTHFREALRLNPQSEFAREGLVEAFRARSPIYRAYLRWALWMQAKSEKSQLAVIIGLYVIARFSRKLFSGPYWPVAALITGFYFLFALWMHVARGVGNFMLLWDPFARLALRRAEKMEAWLVGGFIMVAIPLGVTGAILMNTALLVLAGTLIAAALPFAHTFLNKSTAGRWLFGSIGTFVLAVGLIAFNDELLEFANPATVTSLVTTAVWLSVLSTWLPNWKAIHR